MKCQICNNDYPSQYYFTTPTICTSCFNQLPPEQKEYYYSLMNTPPAKSEFDYRIGFGQRLFAYIIDNILFLVLFFAIMIFTGNYEWLKENINDLKDLQNPAILNELTKRLTILTLILTPIFWSTEIFLAASPGKLFLNLVIANDNRTQATLIKLLVRFSLKHITYIFNLLTFLTAVAYFEFIGNFASLLILLGFFLTLKEKKQALHDLICKTAVFKKHDLIESELF